MENGLTTWYSNIPQYWTEYPITVCNEAKEKLWFWNPWSDKPFHTELHESGTHLVPSYERSLIEYIIFMDKYFDEGILIEGLQTYMDSGLGTLNYLRDEARLFHIDTALIIGGMRLPPQIGLKERFNAKPEVQDNVQKRGYR